MINRKGKETFLTEAENYCERCWEEFTRLDAVEQAIWDALKLGKMPNLVKIQQKERVYKTQRSVLCVNTGEEFPTATIAARYFGLCSTTVSQSALYHKKTRNGLEFKYIKRRK